MPKGTRKTSRVSSAMALRRAWDSEGKGVKTLGVSDEKIRTLVGDQGLQKVKQAEGKGERSFAYSSDEQRTPTQRKESAAKAKSTVDTAMDEAIEMVKKKKTASRSAY